VFANTTIKKLLEEQKLNLPNVMNFPGRNKLVPYVIIVDDAFPLKENIMKPYPGTLGKSSKKRILNYRLSRARRVVENSFGIISAVFRVFRKPLLLEPEKAKLITLACTHLYNFLRKNSASRSNYTPLGSFDQEDLEGGMTIPGNWRKDKFNLTSITGSNGPPTVCFFVVTRYFSLP
jgi:hypothetical protein